MTSIWLDLMGAGVQERFYDAGGVRTRVLECGEGPVLLLLHGTGGHAETYCRNLGPLSEHFRVVAPDLIGHGFTDRPDVDYTLDTFAGHIVDLLDALGAETAILSGESLGAMVSAWVGITHPDRVERAVLNTGILARPDAPGQAQLDDLEQRTMAMAKDGVTLEGVRHRMNWLVSSPDRMTDEMIQVRHRVYTQDGMLDSVATIMSSVIGMIRGTTDGTDYYAPGTMARLEVPTLVLWTVDNPGQSTDLARETAKDLPDGRFEVLDDCAHWPQFEQPEAFNAMHLEFLVSGKVA
jgi:pimeloyl-ACP methyl ester carboxylesterase